MCTEFIEELYVYALVSVKLKDLTRVNETAPK